MERYGRSGALFLATIKEAKDRESFDQVLTKFVPEMRTRYAEDINDIVMMNNEQYLLYKELLMLYIKFDQNMQSIVSNTDSFPFPTRVIDDDAYIDNLNEFSNKVIGPVQQRAMEVGISQAVVRRIYRLAMNFG